MELANRYNVIPFLYEEQAYEGVKRIAGKVAEDVELVCGKKPEMQEISSSSTQDKFPPYFVLFATLGRSRIAAELVQQGKICVERIQGKREVYGVFMIERPFPQVEKILVVCGSDKRGTIYGMFHLSEYIGVSPLCYWGDVTPVKKESIVLKEDIQMVSKEPSVKYRGFFINDEWPCFGNWTFSHFGGFTAEMYDHVFELLLRLKGNYLWPAMWTSSFPLDGPGCLNEELADIYGVVIGFSHHEPCLRASEEWDKVRGENTPYGNDWNYYTNEDGLTNYWADGLKRSGKYEHLVTIGMRGERDSSMLGDDATLYDNIELLKRIITKQRGLIGKYVNEDVDSVPQLLALYKEVEAYFYGDEKTKGLKEWNELENVIFMLCEDNFGHMRTLPTEEIRSHKGGFGMYYHLDYHGGPISYEWMPSTPFSLIWEQMTEAYDYGIRDVWIVNVGDLKGNEVALQYFLSLAFDFEKWGSKAIGSYEEYMQKWTQSVFPEVSEEIRKDMETVYTEFVDINAMRRPEALHAGIYHPCHYGETDRMLQRLQILEQKNEDVYASLKNPEKDAYYSLIYYPAKISINLVRMHLYAGKNEHYAKQGRKAANQYAELVTACMKEDRRLTAEFGNFKNGKWKGMELEQHIGFTKWNDDGYRYPVRMQVEPVHIPRMSVSRADGEEIAVKNYGTPMSIAVDDFLSEGVEQVLLEISNDGVGSLHFTITTPDSHGFPDWLTVTPAEGDVEELVRIKLCCNRRMLPREMQTLQLLISDGEANVAVDIRGKQTLQKEITDRLPKETFLPVSGITVMEANHYAESHGTVKGQFVHLKGYGRSGEGMKVLPATANFTEEEDKPALTYRFLAQKEGNYVVELWTAPVNSLENARPLRAVLENGEGSKETVEILDCNFRAGDHRDAKWCEGVLNQVRVTKAELSFDAGVQELTISALEAGLVLERILIYPADCEPQISYLGPEESWQKK